MSFWLRKYIGEILLESSTGRVRNLSQEELVSLVDSLLGNEGDLVYDPFMGSGTTAKMCKLNKRRYIGSEIDQSYYEISLK